MLPSLLVKSKIKDIDEVPIHYIVKRIRNIMSETEYRPTELKDRIFIIQAMTGSGKSTILPVALFRIIRDERTPLNIPYKGKSVICTQPRILTAMELAKDISVTKSPWNPDMVLFKTVGYQTGPSKVLPSKGLIYATLGILTAQLNNNTDEYIMNKYKFIIIDEAHERSINADFALLLLYNFYLRNKGKKDLPFLILTSATIDTEKYAKYFEIPSTNIIVILGQTYSIQNIYSPHDVVNIFTYVVDIITEICKNQDKFIQSDILVFLPGQQEIKKVQDKLLKLKLNALVLVLNGDNVKNNSVEYIHIFAPRNTLPLINGNPPNRRIILATSVAETGLTIPTCKYVIDTGFHRSLESYPIYNITGLLTRPAAQSRITQRRGRVGRLFNGIYYGVYTKKVFNSLDKQQLPDILTSMTEYCKNHLLLYRISDNFDLSKVRLLDMPSDETFLHANFIATSLGFIDCTNKLTKLGNMVSYFNYITMEQAKIILSGFAYNVFILDLVTICAIMESSKQDIYSVNISKVKPNEVPPDLAIMKVILPNFIHINDNYYQYKLMYSDDFIETLLIFNAFTNTIKITKDIKMVIEWCDLHSINYTTMRTIFDNRDNKINDLISNGIDIFYNVDKSLYNQSEDNYMNTIINIKKCLYEGLRYNLLTYDNINMCYKSLNGLTVSIESVLLDVGLQNQMISNHVITKLIRPKYIITDKYIIGKKKKEYDLIYSITSNYISILDGYVNPDLTFGKPTLVYGNSCINDTPFDIDYRYKVYESINKLTSDGVLTPSSYLTTNI